MPSFNKVFLMGNLTKDPELRYTAGGAPVANLRMAINRVYKLQSGEQKEEVCYVTVVVWRKQAEAAGEHLKKGDPIFVEGRLQSRSWETGDGQKRSTMEVVAERVQFLARGSKGGATASHDGDPGPEATEEAPAPSGSDEDIPF
jgi:single-strand DNA-binding protein